MLYLGIFKLSNKEVQQIEEEKTRKVLKIAINIYKKNKNEYL